MHPTPAGQSRTPWIIAGVLVALVIAGVAYTARKNAPVAPPAMANAGNSVPGTVAAGRAPPLDNMPPREQFSRLNDRIMAAAEAGDTTTVFTFWPMAQGAYQNLPEADRDVDSRYHMATLYLLFGRFPEALALADTIMTESPDNLFGYYLRASIAVDQGDSTKARAARAAFKTHYDSEIAKKRPEYVQHELILKEFLKPSGTL